MENIELRKHLYKTTKTAHLDKIRKGVAYYSFDAEPFLPVHFHVPISEMGDADFNDEVKPSLLWRWFVKP